MTNPSVRSWSRGFGGLVCVLVLVTTGSAYRMPADERGDACGSLPGIGASSRQMEQQFAVHDRGLQWLVMANFGEMSNPNGATSPEPFDPRSATLYPELEYPRGSGTVFLYSGGLWVGARKDGVPIVSTCTDGDNGTNEYAPVLHWQRSGQDMYWFMASRDSSAREEDDDGDWAAGAGNDVNGDAEASADFDGSPGRDDDLDGRADEETLNGSDDDGDGLIDEDVGAIDEPWVTAHAGAAGYRYLNDDASRIIAGDANGDGDPTYDPEPGIDEDPQGDVSADLLDNDADGLIDANDPDSDGDMVTGSNDDDGDGLEDEDGVGRATQEWVTVYADTSEEWLAGEDVDGFTPLGVGVVQHSYQWADSSADDFMLFDYLVTNIGDHVLEDVCLGTFFDFDVGHVTQDPARRSMDDWTFYVDSLQMAVGGDLDGDDGLLAAKWFGVTVVETPLAGVATTYKNFERMTGGDPIDNREKYDLLSSGERDPDALSVGDWRFVLAFGPLGHLVPRQTLCVTVAVVNGEDTGALIRNAEQAKAMFQILSARDRETPWPVAAALGNARPNPFNGEVALPLTLSLPAKVAGGVYNARGELVDKLEHGLMGAGEHTVVWHSGEARPGIYLYRVKVGRQCLSGRMVLAK